MKFKTQVESKMSFPEFAGFLNTNRIKKLQSSFGLEPTGIVVDGETSGRGSVKHEYPKRRKVNVRLENVKCLLTEEEILEFVVIQPVVRCGWRWGTSPAMVGFMPAADRMRAISPVVAVVWCRCPTTA